MLLNNNLLLKADSTAPQRVDPKLETTILNYEQPVSIKPIVEDTVWNNNNPIIIVPGVMGSRLFDKKGGAGKVYRQVWPPVLGPKEESQVHRTIKQSDELNIKNTLYIPDYTIEQVNRKKVESTAYYSASNAVDSSVTQSREYGAKDVYENLVNTVCEEFPNREVFFFSYDWRQSNTNSASELSRFISFLVGRYPKNHEKYTDKVDIVCHSMGGLVASTLSLIPGTKRDPLMLPDADLRSPSEKIGKIITLGTPYEGSVNLLRAILTYEVMYNKNEEDLLDRALGWGSDRVFQFGGLSKKVKLHLTGVTQLAPTKSYINVVPQNHAIDEHQIKNIYPYRSYPVRLNQNLTAAEFHEICSEIFTENPSYTDILTFQNSIANGLLSMSNSYFGMGGNQRTLRSLTLKLSARNDINYASFSEEIICVDASFETRGDGTVPFLSANKFYKISAETLGKERVKYFYNCDHTQLSEFNEPINWAVEILKNGKSIEGDNNPPEGESHIDVRTACPVDVIVSNGVQSLKSNSLNPIQNTKFGDMIFLGREGEIKLMCLDKGQYSVELQGTGTGKMDYSVRFFDSSNSIVESRDFYDVPITKDTFISTEINQSEQTVLSVQSPSKSTLKPDITKNYRLTSEVVLSQSSEENRRILSVEEATKLYEAAETAADAQKTVCISGYHLATLETLYALADRAETDDSKVKLEASQMIDKTPAVSLRLSPKESLHDAMLEPIIYITQEAKQYLEFPIIIPKDTIVIDFGQGYKQAVEVIVNTDIFDAKFEKDKLNAYLRQYGTKAYKKLPPEQWRFEDGFFYFGVEDFDQIVIGDTIEGLEGMPYTPIGSDTAKSVDAPQKSSIVSAPDETKRSDELVAERSEPGTTQALFPPVTYPIYLVRTYPNQKGEVIIYSIGYSADNLIAKFGINSKNHEPYRINIKEKIGEEAYQIVLRNLYEFVMSHPEQKYPHKLLIGQEGILESVIDN